MIRPDMLAMSKAFKLVLELSIKYAAWIPIAIDCGIVFTVDLSQSKGFGEQYARGVIAFGPRYPFVAKSGDGVLSFLQPEAP